MAPFLLLELNNDVSKFVGCFVVTCNLKLFICHKMRSLLDSATILLEHLIKLIIYFQVMYYQGLKTFCCDDTKKKEKITIVIELQDVTGFVSKLLFFWHIAV